MKKIVYLALVAMVAVVATSCKPKGTAPKAGFDYENEGLVVTFTNSTTGDGTITYAWNFGDDKGTSTEKNPVYTYAAEGTYTVTMTATNEFGNNVATETVVLELPVIVVDGDFSDWDAAEDVAVALTNDSNKYESLYAIKFVTDADYIYFYFEFDGTGEEGDYMVDPIDIYLDVDGDLTTGSNSYLWENSAADILVEGFWSNNYSDAQFYSFPAEADQSEWAWVEAGGVGATTTCDKVDLGGGKAAIEGSIMRAMMPITPVGLRVGVFSSTTEWAESGCLPSHTLTTEGATVPSPLMDVVLK